jgi:crossover junction endodeoxyribonuclease RuvC
MIVCGIDPGVSGAVAVIDTNIGLADVVDLPQGPYGLDPVAFAEQLDAWGVRSVTLEDNRAMGSNGSLANFSMGRAVGLIIASVLLTSRPLHRVKPQEWQRSVGVTSIKAAERKEAHRQRARELFPECEAQLKRKADHNRADALLIAEYARRGPA